MNYKYRFTILGKLPSQNEYIKQCNSHYSVGAKFKRETENDIIWQIPYAYKGVMLSGVIISFIWYEQNRRRDEDNVKWAKKFILDALVTAGVIAGDGQKHIIRLIDSDIMVDKKNPRVEVEIEEVKND